MPRDLNQLCVIKQIQAAVLVFPHLRVGQLIDNAVTTFKNEMPEIYSGDLFYIPDDILATAIERYVEKFGGK